MDLHGGPNSNAAAGLRQHVGNLQQAGRTACGDGTPTGEIFTSAVTIALIAAVGAAAS